jgi:hypothetical protein
MAGVPIDRFVITYTRAPTTPPNQDVLTMGMHFARRTSLEGSTATPLDNTIRAAVEAAWMTFESTYKAQRPPYVTQGQFVWTDAWPVGEPPHAAIRRIDATSVGTGSGTMVLPPQCAINCTLVTAHRRHWGRFALGGMIASASTLDGNGTCAGIRPTLYNALKTFLDACATAGASPVVLRRPTWVDKQHSAVKDPGSFYPVTDIRVDDIYDIIRRRRWEHTTATQRSAGALTVPAANPGIYATGPYPAATR